MHRFIFFISLQAALVLPLCKTYKMLFNTSASGGQKLKRVPKVQGQHNGPVWMSECSEWPSKVNAARSKCQSWNERPPCQVLSSILTSAPRPRSGHSEVQHGKSFYSTADVCGHVVTNHHLIALVQHVELCDCRADWPRPRWCESAACRRGLCSASPAAPSSPRSPSAKPWGRRSRPACGWRPPGSPSAAASAARSRPSSGTPTFGRRQFGGWTDICLMCIT